MESINEIVLQHRIDLKTMPSPSAGRLAAQRASDLLTAYTTDMMTKMRDGITVNLNHKDIQDTINANKIT
jgi:hypothetical protein